MSTCSPDVKASRLRRGHASRPCVEPASLGLGFSGSRGRHAGQYFGRHGLKVSIGYRLSPLDMGPCARRRRLGAILGCGAGTSTIRVDGLGFLGLDARLTQSRCVTMIALTQVRGSQVSMGAEGGSNALSTGNGRALQNFSDFVGTKCTGFRGGRTRGCETGAWAQNSRFHTCTACMLALYVVHHH